MGDFFADNLWEIEPDFAKDNTNELGEDGEYEENENYYGAQHIIALVDCHPDMFQKMNAKGSDDKNQSVSAIDLSLKLVQTLLQQTIEQTVIRKTGKRNGVGLLLYNTKTIREDDNKKDVIDGADNDSDDDDKMDDEYDNDSMDEGADDDQEHSPPSVSSVHRLLDLKPPGITHVQTLQKITGDKRGQQKESECELKIKFCPSTEETEPTIAPLQIALEESTRMFLNAKCVRESTNNANGKREYDNKSIWIFTNQTNPYSDELNRLTQNIANEAKEQRIEIIVWPLAVHPDSNHSSIKNDEDFVSPFFEAISTEILFNQRIRSYDELHEGLEEIYRAMVKKRRSYHGPMHILRPDNVGNIRSLKDPAIMIDWYSIVQLAKRPGKIQIDSATKKETVKIRLTLEKDTGKEVAKFWTRPTAEQREFQRSQPGMQRFRQFFKFANELVPITIEDMKKINTNANGNHAPGLTILGFKPSNSIPTHHYILKPFLIFPNDSEVEGSIDAFMNLHSAMLRKNVLAVGEVLQRESSQARLVAIYPFEETDFMPPGMYVQMLPFEDEIRNVVPDEASIEADFQRKEHISLAKKGHDDTLTLPHTQNNKNGYEVKREEFNNNANEHVFLSEIDNQEHATGNIATDSLVDAAINLINRQSLSSKAIGVDFENAALTEFYSYLKSIAFDTTKEENIYDTIVDKDIVLEHAGNEIDAFLSFLPLDVIQPKKTKKRTRKTVPDDSGVDWMELYEVNEIGTCKIDQLKKYLRSVGLPVTGRKDDLVERVAKSLEQKCAGDNDTKLKKEEENVNQGNQFTDL